MESSLFFHSKNCLSEYWGLTDCVIPHFKRKNFRNKLGVFECTLDISSGERIISDPIIYISSDVLDFGSNFLIKEVLKHELCHYAMLLKGLPYFDGDIFFEQELQRIGTFSSKSVHTYFVVTCFVCHSQSSFPNKTDAKTFFKKKCECGSKDKQIKFFADSIYSKHNFYIA